MDWGSLLNTPIAGDSLDYSELEDRKEATLPTFSKIVLALLNAALICCVALSALQTLLALFSVQPWSGQYLLIFGFFLCEAIIGTFSVMRKRGAAAAAGLYGALMTWLWWHFICAGHFIREDFMWIELPALIFTACVLLRSTILNASGGNEPRPAILP
jgi:hypothetical protein